MGLEENNHFFIPYIFFVYCNHHIRSLFQRAYLGTYYQETLVEGISLDLFCSVFYQCWIALLEFRSLVERNMGFVLLLSTFVGIIPESGPYLIFVMMYANGLIPFSVLLTSSIAQDGHGMLPLLSYTIKDSILIKVFNILFALIIGLIFYYLTP